MSIVRIAASFRLPYSKLDRYHSRCPWADASPQMSDAVKEDLGRFATVKRSEILVKERKEFSTSSSSFGLLLPSFFLGKNEGKRASSARPGDKSEEGIKASRTFFLSSDADMMEGSHSRGVLKLPRCRHHKNALSLRWFSGDILFFSHEKMNDRNNF